MKIQVQKSFEKDVSKVADKAVATRLFSLLEDIELYKSVLEIPHIKKNESRR